jgi:hypothetical protein
MGLFNWLFGKGAPADGAESAPPRARVPVLVQNKGYNLEVVGEQQHQNALLRLVGGHSRSGHREEFEALLRAQPGNPHDPNAVAVFIREAQVGYLPADKAAAFRAKLPEVTEAKCWAVVVGGWRTNQHDEGSCGVYLNARWPPRLDLQS